MSSFFVYIVEINFFGTEIVYRFYNRSTSARALHAQESQHLQVQGLAYSGFHPLRVLYHDANCFQHPTPYDEGKPASLSLLTVNALPLISIIFAFKKYHNQGEMYEKSLKYINMGFTGMFSVETVLKIIGFGVKVVIIAFVLVISN